MQKDCKRELNPSRLNGVHKVAGCPRVPVCSVSVRPKNSRSEERLCPALVIFLPDTADVEQPNVRLSAKNEISAHIGNEKNGFKCKCWCGNGRHGEMCSCALFACASLRRLPLKSILSPLRRADVLFRTKEHDSSQVFLTLWLEFPRSFIPLPRIASSRRSW